MTFTFPSCVHVWIFSSKVFNLFSAFCSNAGLFCTFFSLDFELHFSLISSGTLCGCWMMIGTFSFATAKWNTVHFPHKYDSMQNTINYISRVMMPSESQNRNWCIPEEKKMDGNEKLGSACFRWFNECILSVAGTCTGKRKRKKIIFAMCCSHICIVLEWCYCWCSFAIKRNQNNNY